MSPDGSTAQSGHSVLVEKTQTTTRKPQNQDGGAGDSISTVHGSQSTRISHLEGKGNDKPLHTDGRSILKAVLFCLHLTSFWKWRLFAPFDIVTSELVREANISMANFSRLQRPLTNQMMTTWGKDYVGNRTCVWFRWAPYCRRRLSFQKNEQSAEVVISINLWF